VLETWREGKAVACFAIRDTGCSWRGLAENVGIAEVGLGCCLNLIKDISNGTYRSLLNEVVVSHGDIPWTSSALSQVHIPSFHRVFGRDSRIRAANVWAWDKPTRP
jgi:hypothetical protein